MPFYVYILLSEIDETYYKGLASDYLARFKDHNEGKSRYTSGKMPWRLIYAEEHPDKRSALIRERKLKSCKAEYFQWLISQPTFDQYALGHCSG